MCLQEVLTVKYSLPMTTCSCVEVLIVKYSLPMTTCSCVEVLTVKYSPPMTMCSCTGVLIASLDWFALVFDQSLQKLVATSCHQFQFWLPTFGNFKYQLWSGLAKMVKKLDQTRPLNTMSDVLELHGQCQNISMMSSLTLDLHPNIARISTLQHDAGLQVNCHLSM